MVHRMPEKFDEGTHRNEWYTKFSSGLRLYVAPTPRLVIL